MRRLALLSTLTFLAASARAGEKTPEDPDELPLDEPAGRLNADGMRLYRAGKLEEAARLFRDAIEADDRRPAPHHNLARALARLRASGRTCENDAYQRVILEHLATAIRLDPSRKDRLAGDAALDAVRNTFGFQALLGKSPHAKADLPGLLTRPNWEGPESGAMGPTSGIDFEDGGRVTFWRLEDEELAERARYAGRWRILDDGTVEVTIDRPAGDLPARSTLRLGWDGILEGALGRFDDDPEDCSA